jgi:hypothetical protein
VILANSVAYEWNGSIVCVQFYFAYTEQMCIHVYTYFIWVKAYTNEEFCKYMTIYNATSCRVWKFLLIIVKMWL